MPKPNKIRLTLHLKSLLALAENRHITFNHPQLEQPIELCIGDDVDLVVQLLDDKQWHNMFGTNPDFDPKLSN